MANEVRPRPHLSTSFLIHNQPIAKLLQPEEWRLLGRYAAWFL
jgi:hypothetical protein